MLVYAFSPNGLSDSRKQDNVSEEEFATLQSRGKGCNSTTANSGRTILRFIKSHVRAKRDVEDAFATVIGLRFTFFMRQKRACSWALSFGPLILAGRQTWT